MMRNLFLILFSSLFIYISTASAEGGLSASTRSNDTGSEENYEDDFFDDDFDDDFFNDDVDIDLIGPAGVTGAVRRHDRREDRREFRDDREKSNNRLRHR
jgi:hypothetical protein